MSRLFYDVVNPFIAIFLVIFVGVGFALSVFLDLTVTAWVVIFAASFVFCCALFIIKKPNFSTGLDDGAVTWTRRDRIIGYLPYLVFLPGFLVVFSNTYFQMIFEGLIHTSYINQILAGSIPPENPFLPGYPPNYYWLYHMLLAMLSQLTNLAAPLLASLINVFALLSIFAWIKQSLRAMGFGQQRPVLLNTLVIFVVFGLNVFGLIHALDNVVSNGIGGDIDRDMIFIGTDHRLRSLWFKFLAFNSFPLTIVFFAMGIFAAIQLVKGHIRLGTVLLLLTAVAGGTAFNLGTGMYSAAVLIPAVVVAFLLVGLLSVKSISIPTLRSQAAAAYQVIRAKLSTLDMVIIVVVGVVLALLMRRYYVGITSSYSVTGGFSLFSAPNLLNEIGAFYPLIPLFIMAIIYALKTCNRPVIFTGSAAVLGCLVSYVSVLRGDNQYKFVHLSSLLVCITVVFVFYRWLSSSEATQSQRLKRNIVMILLVLVLLNVSYTGLIRVQSTIGLKLGMSFVPEITDITYNGRNLLSGREPYQDNFLWLRDSSPPQTIVFLPVKSSILLTMLSSRLPYAGQELFSFVKDIPEYAERIRFEDTFFAPETTRETRQQIVDTFLAFEPVRSKMFLIPHDMALPQEELDALKLQRVFQGQNADIYAPQS